MYVKTLPLLMDCGNRDVASFLAYASELVNTAMKHDLYPFRLLAKEYGVRVGDTLTLRDPEFRALTVTVSGIFDNFRIDLKLVDTNICKYGF